MSNMQASDDAITAKIKALTDEIGALRKEQHELRVEASGVRLGDIVRYKDGRECKVSDIDTSWQARKLTSKPWLKGFFRKKNGDWSTAERHLFSDWTLIEK